MKNRKFIIIIATLILCVSLGIAVASSKDFPGKKEAIQVGTEMSGPVNALIDKSKESDEITMGVVLGKKISKDYFNWEYSLCKATGSKEPAKRAWELIKLEVYERNLAIKEGFMPTQEEIKKCSDEMRAVVESTEDSHNLVCTIAKQMNMTEDEYWNDYQAKYEAPLQLIRSRVDEYLEKNDLTKPSPDEIEGEIYEIDYFNSLN